MLDSVVDFYRVLAPLYTQSTSYCPIEGRMRVTENRMHVTENRMHVTENRMHVTENRMQAVH
jgi:uncharacterized Rmd1/YagE family protein